MHHRHVEQWPQPPHAQNYRVSSNTEGRLNSSSWGSIVDATSCETIEAERSRTPSAVTEEDFELSPSFPLTVFCSKVVELFKNTVDSELLLQLIQIKFHVVCVVDLNCCVVNLIRNHHIGFQWCSVSAGWRRHHHVGKRNSCCGLPSAK